MARLFQLLLAVVVCGSRALQLSAYDDPCPFGYGANCGGGGPIDSATKAQVAKILGGILGKLTSQKSLVENAHTVSKKSTPAAATIATQKLPAPVQKALTGLITRLQTKKEQASAGSAIGRLLAADTPFICWDCKGGDKTLDAGTKAQVASILNGILKNLGSH